MEFTDLTDKKRIAITLEVLNKTSFLKLLEHNELDKNSHRSLEHVKRFLTIPEEDLLDDLLATFDAIRSSFNVAIQGTQPPLAMYNVLWGRICIWLYFFKHDDPLWTEYLFPQILNGRINKSVYDDVVRAREKMDEYFKQQIRINNYITAKRMTQPATANQTILNKETIQQETPKPEDKKAGRPKHNLFVDKQHEQLAYEQFTNYLKQHKLSSRMIIGAKDDTLNKTIACFCWRWKDLEYIEELSPSALYRFLHEVCQMEFEIIEKTFTNKMGEILRNRQSYNGLWGDVKAYIEK